MCGIDVKYLDLFYYSYFEPYIWKKVVVQTWDKHIVADLRLHGSVIRDLSCHRVDRSVLRSISHFNTTLQTLHLTLDQHSVFVHYDQLDETFIRTQACLTTVSIKFDSSLLNVSILWTLSRLPHLTYLCLQVYGTVDMAALHAEVLSCCLALQFLKLDRWKPSGSLPLLRRLKTNVQRTVAPKAQRSPTTVQEAIERNVIAPNNQTSAFSVVQPRRHLPSTLEQGTNTNIRRLDLGGHSGDIPAFIKLIKSCSRLDELSLRDGLTALDPPSWVTLSSCCPKLRTLRLAGLKSSLLIGNSLLLITHFPQLESLYIHIKAVQWVDWTTTNIDQSLAEHQRKFGTRHPIKTLSLTGDNTTSLPVLLSILSARSISIETLAIGSLWTFQQYFEKASYRRNDGFRFLTEMSKEYLRSPWQTAKETLARLDIHSTIIATNDITNTFFRRLQDLPHLQALCVSTKHIYDWVPIAFRVPHYVWKGRLPIAEAFSRSSCSNLNNSNFSNLTLPTVEYSFPSLDEFIVKSSGFGPHIMTTSTHAIFCIAAMPALECFLLEDGSISKETLGTLKDGFPKQFKPIPKERLAWIETVHGYK